MKDRGNEILETIDWDMPIIMPEKYMTKEEQYMDTKEARELAEKELRLRALEEKVIKLRQEVIDSVYLDGIFPYVAANEIKRNLNKFERSITGMDIKYQNPAIIVTIPALMPHRTSRPHVFYTEILEDYLEEFRSENMDICRKFYENIENGVEVIVISHVNSHFLIRDSDNISLKAVIDTFVRCGYMKDDEGTYMSLHIFSEYNPTFKNITTIHIVPKKDFLNYINKFYE